MTHTPGPWVAISEDHDISVEGEGWFEGQNVNGWVVVGNIAQSGMAIAVIDTGDFNSWDDETLDANVALVSAAPDLLAAGNDLLKLFEAMSDGGTAWQVAAMRAAVARATGNTA